MLIVPIFFSPAFPNVALKYESPQGIKGPKFSKFFREVGESIVKHVARYQIKCGDLANDDYLKMKYFSSSLTRDAFTWFTILPLILVPNWGHLEIIF